jgi:cell division protein FtsA
MDTRIGYPNEHLAGNSDEEIASPLYATAVGLVMKSIENKSQSAVKIDAIVQPKVPTYRPPIANIPVDEVLHEVEDIQNTKTNTSEKQTSTVNRIQRNFFDRYVDKIKNFLDNAE